MVWYDMVWYSMVWYGMVGAGAYYWSRSRRPRLAWRGATVPDEPTTRALWGKYDS